MRAAVTWWDRHQVSLYVAAMLAAALWGSYVPSAQGLKHGVNPSLALLLYATFVGLPLGLARTRAQPQPPGTNTNWRFLATVVGLNFVVVPPLVWVLTRLVSNDPVLLLGVALVLLCPCVDYVLVFTGLAGGAASRLLAATPVLMVLQMVLVPFLLWWVVGSSALAVIRPGPFLMAFLTLIVLPLGAAWLTQRLGRVGQRIQAVAADVMVPLMMLTLFVVIASQIRGVGERWNALAAAALVYVFFAVIMNPVGAFVSRRVGLAVAQRRAVVFSGVTRNSLVVLPLAVALPAGFSLVPLVVVTQTLVELVAMVIMVRVVPRLVR